ncbi:MAG TPA: bifunctional diaminohydroxyphosphoribosylaminopyrimidine deaminase/5-amino-6-(5-phosphoribosylamino)uracil reductase RibD [Pseudonocardiaceae bacterium]
MHDVVRLATRGLGRTSPNPPVGCVILGSDGDVAGRGWHRGAGRPHAEIVALGEAGTRACGGTAIVTLEPCSRTGRTGPCTEALIAAGLRRVVYALDDPLEGGAGAGRLAAAGIEVSKHRVASAAAVTGPWIHAVRTGRPFVTYKVAATFDGRVGAADGTSKWITSAQARNDAHRLRRRVDAVMVGVGTVLADDPALTARTSSGKLCGPQPLRVVLDRSGRTPRTARLVTDGYPTLIITCGDGPQEGYRSAVQRAVVPETDFLDHALALLFTRGLRHILLEGGPTIAGALLQAGHIGRIELYQGGGVLGGAAVPLLRGCPPGATLTDLRRLTLEAVRRVGTDVRLTLTPQVGTPQVGTPQGPA